MIFQPRSGTYTVGDFMTKKDDLQVVKPTTTVDEGNTLGFYFCKYILGLVQSFYSLSFVVTALEALVEKRITGFPVVDDHWKLVILFMF